jgi:hypothetical protein
VTLTSDLPELWGDCYPLLASRQRCPRLNGNLTQAEGHGVCLGVGGGWTGVTQLVQAECYRKQLSCSLGSIRGEDMREHLLPLGTPKIDL